MTTTFYNASRYHDGKRDGQRAAASDLLVGRYSRLSATAFDSEPAYVQGYAEGYRTTWNAGTDKHRDDWHQRNHTGTAEPASWRQCALCRDLFEN